MFYETDLQDGLTQNLVVIENHWQDLPWDQSQVDCTKVLMIKSILAKVQTAQAHYHVQWVTRPLDQP